MQREQRPPSPFSTLVRAFVGRFFENEIAAGSNDLKSSFFWLVAFFAPLGVMFPWLMVFEYSVVAMAGGPELLRTQSMADKLFYLGFGMVATGGVTIVTWHGLLLDRRDALVLGVLPVGGWTVVSAKLLALAIYGALVTTGMHALASLNYGLLLGQASPTVVMLRIAAAHFTASVLASLSTLFAVAAVQGVVLVTAGPRLFARLSPLLQVATTMALLALAISLPSTSMGIVQAVGAGDGWIAYSPPAWFLGIYEVVLGTSSPVLHDLARRALVAGAVAVVVTIVVYPLAFRRVARAAVEMGPAASTRSSRIAAWLERALSRRPVVRGATQFLLATLLRVERHRFVLALSAGVAATFVLPAVVASLRVAETVTTPPVAVLAAPLLAMTAVLIGLRLAVSLPGDVRANWIFSLLSVGDREAQTAVRRVLYMVGVGLVVGGWIAATAGRWEIGLVITHASLTAAIGVMVSEALLYRREGLACARSWRPEGAGLRKWWPAYLAAFLLLDRGVPALSLAWQHRPWLTAALIGALLGGAFLLRRSSDRAIAASLPEDDDDIRVQVMNLS